MKHPELSRNIPSRLPTPGLIVRQPVRKACRLEAVLDAMATNSLKGGLGFDCFNNGVGSQIIQQSLMDIIKTAIGHDQDDVSRSGGEY